MALFGSGPKLFGKQGIVGLKLEISHDITPRDTSIGTKIFTLVPPEARTVSEVKTYLANFVLRTPIPFHIFMGEYRIREMEDAEIFSLVTEPCRLVPVPLPRSALSSTPKPKSCISSDASSASGSGKRVTFFDGDISTSPVFRPREMEPDVLDARLCARQEVVNHQKHFYTPSPNAENILVGQNDELANNEGNSSSEERKKRRRRKHKSKKATKLDAQDSQMEGVASNAIGIQNLDLTEAEPEPVSGNTVKRKHSIETTSNGGALEVLNEETESEDETAVNAADTASTSKEFLTPPSVPNKRTEAFRGIKKAKLSDSAFVSSDSFISPVASHSDVTSSGKVRQDTPIVPRVIRNPKVFDSARKILDVFTTSANGSGDLEHGNERIVGDRANDGDAEVNPATISQGNCSYDLLKLVNSHDELNVGDVVAFKVLELDERYNPSISAFKEAIVTEKEGDMFTMKYIKNEAIVRTGKYEFQDDEDLQNTDAESIVIIKFPEFIEPKLVAESGVASPVSV